MNSSDGTFRLVDKVWDEIRKSHDPRFEGKLDAVRLKYEAIKTRLAAGALGPDVSATERGVASTQIAIAVLAFVARACDYYDTVRAYRALTDQETLIGHDLSSLLEEAEAVLPKGGLGACCDL